MEFSSQLMIIHSSFNFCIPLNWFKWDEISRCRPEVTRSCSMCGGCHDSVVKISFKCLFLEMLMTSCKLIFRANNRTVVFSDKARASGLAAGDEPVQSSHIKSKNVPDDMLKN